MVGLKWIGLNRCPAADRMCVDYPPRARLDRKWLDSDESVGGLLWSTLRTLTLFFANFREMQVYDPIGR